MELAQLKGSIEDNNTLRACTHKRHVLKAGPQRGVREMHKRGCREEYIALVQRVLHAELEGQLASLTADAHLEV